MEQNRQLVARLALLAGTATAVVRDRIHDGHPFPALVLPNAKRAVLAADKAAHPLSVGVVTILKARQSLTPGWEGEAPAAPGTASTHGFAGASPSRKPRQHAYCGKTGRLG